ncbi:peptide chain release factor N(5)-glutamine methyltransferase [Marinilactibacillus kalidii]|uniref:peptide chain release factor N(5)-glutamine methyltransferase n=1 Tax=Marinilactibacillus kalidii TaxID=2820274 RepID=UPI001FC9F555|nr:peptide chain release factor N(5)-glutamine methyltransferase [Marinilactibacillus kalidii]
MNMNDLNHKNTIREVLSGASSFLNAQGLEGYAAEWLLKERFDLSKTTIVKRGSETMPFEMKARFFNDLEQYIGGRPVQHIVGHEWFYDRKFTVTSDTLIPRPETEEWFDRYLKGLPDRQLTVLDIGTGTGVLGISHKLERPKDEVTLVDISPEALAIAQKNAQQLGADVNVCLSDLTAELQSGKYDLVVSNPPYISTAEHSEMDRSVLEYEPALALFAEQEGLEIYKRLASELPAILEEDAQIILEIGYRQAASVKAIFEKVLPDADITIWKDMAGLDRVVYIQTVK